MGSAKKNTWFRCLISFFLASGIAALLCFLFDGPRLGPFYDFLLRQRRSYPVSQDILIIDSSVPGQELGDDILEPGAAASLFYTMTELGGRTLIIQVPILGLSAGGTAGEAEIIDRFDEEFSILSRNIRNLFDGIRTGSVAPAESTRYVGELVDLSEKGKERLVSALVRRDEEGIVTMEKAAALFGHVRRPGDLRVQLIRAGKGGWPGVLAERDEYSRSRPDRDGVLRRIAPVITVPEFSEGEAGERTLEHIIYGALKTRYKSSGIEHSDSGRFLAARNSPDGKDTIIPLDRTGAVLFEVPRKGDDFRRIGISDFLEYDEADRSLRRLLADGETLGIYQGIEGEKHPSILYDYALSLRDELVSSPDFLNEEKKSAWIEARNSYFACLEAFLYGPAEMNLVSGYEAIIASESLGEAAVTKMTGMRDSLIRTFVSLRARYNEVFELREKIESALTGSFCILGRASSLSSPPPASTYSWFHDFPRGLISSIRSALFKTYATDVEASALLANSILSGRVVKPGGYMYLFCFSVVCAFFVCFLIKSFGPAPVLGIGTLLSLLVCTGFSLSFILSGFWLDPLVPAAAAAAGTLVSFAWTLIAGRRYSRRFRLAYGPCVSGSCLRSVIRAGRPLPSQAATVRAAVVAVKNSEPAARGNPQSAEALPVLAFHEKVSDLFRKAGGTIIGTDADLVTVCFGSPLERVFLRGKEKMSPYEDNIHALAAPALRAADIVSEIARRPDCGFWHFGLDIGSCTFAWTALSGYFALGSAVRKARILSRLAGRYRTRIVISSSVNEALPDLIAKKLDVLKEKDGQGGEPFYRLAVRE